MPKQNLIWQLSLVLLSLGLALAIVIFFDSSPEAVITAGGTFQLLGVYVVVDDIYHLRRKLKRPSLKNDILSEIKKLSDVIWERIARAFGKPRHYVLKIDPAKVSIQVSGKMHYTKGFNKSLSVEERISVIEERIIQIHHDIEDIDDKFQEELKSIKRTIALEQEEREKLHQEITGQITDMAADGLRFKVAGVIWLTGGIVLTTWPNQMACFLTLLH